MTSRRTRLRLVPSEVVQLSRVPRVERRWQERLARLFPTVHERPSTRGDCISGPRPCPFVGCKWNLYLDVLRTGSIKLNFPDLEPDELTDSCALDVADEGGTSIPRIGDLLNLTFERVRQIEERALKRLRLPILREVTP